MQISNLIMDFQYFLLQEKFFMVDYQKLFFQDVQLLIVQIIIMKNI